MSNQEGFWWSFGRACYKGFEALEAIQNFMNPWIWLMFTGAAAMCIWIYVQHKYNKQAAANGTLK